MKDLWVYLREIFSLARIKPMGLLATLRPMGLLATLRIAQNHRRSVVILQRIIPIRDSIRMGPTVSSPAEATKKIGKVKGLLVRRQLAVLAVRVIA